MAISTHILEQINKLLLELETKYPELYSFIDEEPITIPNLAHPDVNDTTLQDYLESLKRLLLSHH
ncbi:hypothetical protein [Christiangramia salexigens]|uniref:Uncharacterized protein n=1 Tax=Christiangramia salexigens TaxID=1913577 RepID=A0A1L3J1N9_9FLAO|nr:hypothetical protein [Christiangramia salexigens]APG59031.1 hypothetical protein LPB144_00810 [Christiangramia salexigens]